MKTRTLVFTAIFASLSAVISPLSIPIGAVPINFVHIPIFISGAVLGAKFGAISQVIFILLGVIGMPVFGGFNSGPAILLGPTGGFILSYIVCSFLVGWFSRKNNVMTILAMFLGLLVTYTMGTLWFMFITRNSLIVSLSVTVFPFLVGDFFKVIISFLIINRIITKIDFI